MTTLGKEQAEQLPNIYIFFLEGSSIIGIVKSNENIYIGNDVIWLGLNSCSCNLIKCSQKKKKKNRKPDLQFQLQLYIWRGMASSALDALHYWRIKA